MESSFRIGNDLQERYFTSGGEAGVESSFRIGNDLQERYFTSGGEAGVDGVKFQDRQRSSRTVFSHPAAKPEC